MYYGVDDGRGCNPASVELNSARRFARNLCETGAAVTMVTKPRPNTADAALDELLVLVTLAKDVPSAAKALQDVFESGAVIVVCHPDRDATVIAGKPRFRFELNETLARYLATFHARQLVNG